MAEQIPAVTDEVHQWLHHVMRKYFEVRFPHDMIPTEEVVRGIVEFAGCVVMMGSKDIAEQDGDVQQSQFVQRCAYLFNEIVSSQKP
jgi:hypothetical protein